MSKFSESPDLLYSDSDCPRQAEGLVIEWFEEEALVLDEKQGLVHQLNVSAAKGLALCDGATSVAAIKSAFQREFDAPDHVIDADVERLLNDLAELKLVLF